MPALFSIRIFDVLLAMLLPAIEATRPSPLLSGPGDPDPDGARPPDDRCP